MDEQNFQTVKLLYEAKKYEDALKFIDSLSNYQFSLELKRLAANCFRETGKKGKAGKLDDEIRMAEKATSEYENGNHEAALNIIISLPSYQSLLELKRMAATCFRNTGNPDQAKKMDDEIVIAEKANSHYEKKNYEQALTSIKEKTFVLDDIYGEFTLKCLAMSGATEHLTYASKVYANRCASKALKLVQENKFEEAGHVLKDHLLELYPSSDLVVNEALSKLRDDIKKGKEKARKKKQKKQRMAEGVIQGVIQQSKDGESSEGYLASGTIGVPEEIQSAKDIGKDETKTEESFKGDGGGDPESCGGDSVSESVPEERQSEEESGKEIGKDETEKEESSEGDGGRDPEVRQSEEVSGKEIGKDETKTEESFKGDGGRDLEERQSKEESGKEIGKDETKKEESSEGDGGRDPTSVPDKRQSEKESEKEIGEDETKTEESFEGDGGRDPEERQSEEESGKEIGKDETKKEKSSECDGGRDPASVPEERQSEKESEKEIGKDETKKDEAKKEKKKKKRAAPEPQPPVTQPPPLTQTKPIESPPKTVCVIQPSPKPKPKESPPRTPPQPPVANKFTSKFHFIPGNKLKGNQGKGNLVEGFMYANRATEGCDSPEKWFTKTQMDEERNMSFITPEKTQIEHIEHLKSISNGNNFIVKIDHMLITPPSFAVLVGEPLIPIDTFFEQKRRFFLKAKLRTTDGWWKHIEESFTNIFRDVLHGLIYLDSMQLMCGNLKCGIYIDERASAKILPLMDNSLKEDVDIKDLLVKMEQIITLPFCVDKFDDSFKLPQDLKRLFSFFNKLVSSKSLKSGNIPLFMLYNHPFFWISDERTTFIKSIRGDLKKLDGAEIFLDVRLSKIYTGFPWDGVIDIPVCEEILLYMSTPEGLRYNVYAALDIVIYMVAVYTHINDGVYVKIRGDNITYEDEEIEAILHGFFPNIYSDLYESICELMLEKITDGHTRGMKRIMKKLFHKRTKMYRVKEVPGDFKNKLATLFKKVYKRDESSR